MIPTMLVVGLALGLLPRRWPNALAVTTALAVLVSLAFGFLIGELLGGGALALANTTIGIALGELVQTVVASPAKRRTA
ncbi:MAG: hypothetical protein ACTHN0_04795 [Aquihabitans sp.]